MLSPFLIFAQIEKEEVKEVRTLIKKREVAKAEKLLGSFIDEILPSDTVNYIAAYKLKAATESRKGEHENRIKTLNFLLDYLPDYRVEKGDIYYSVGSSYKKTGNSSAYIEVNKSAAGIFLNILGSNHQKYTKTLNSLGDAYQISGRYIASRNTFEDAKKIKERNRKKDIQYARILNNLGKAYTSLGRFEDAEKCFEASFNLKNQLKGKDFNYALTLALHANLLQELGRYEEGVLEIDEALAITKASKKLPARTKTELLISYQEIKAGLFVSSGKLDEAIEIYEKLRKERLSFEKNEKSSNYAKTLHNLSDLYLDLDQNDKALNYVKEAEEIFKEKHGYRHPYYAKAIRKKADALLAKRQLDGIEKLYKTSSKIIARTYGEDHIEYFKAEYAYFLYLKETKKSDLAITKAKQIEKIITNYIIKIGKYLSIQEILKITDIYKAYYQEVLALANLNNNNPEIKTLAFDCSLFYKGYILETLLKIKKAIRESKEITAYSEQLTELKSKLGRQLEMDVKNYNLIDSLEEKIEDISIALSRSIGSLRKEDEQVNWTKLQRNLSYDNDEAIIDFVRFYSDNKKDTLYAAMIILPEADAPLFVNLFLESEITKHFKGKVSNSLELVAHLYKNASRKLKPSVPKNSVELYDLIWKPIAPHLKGIKTIYYVCDGIMHNIALHAISTTDNEESDSMVAHTYNALRLTSLQSLIRTKELKFLESQRKALLIGGVRYGEMPDTSTGNRKGQLTVKYLTATAKEVDNIAKMMKEKTFEVHLLKKEAPKKDSVKMFLNQNSSLNILHFATHGYFDNENLLNVKSKFKIAQSNLELSRSGLVLANANQLSKREAILTAYEISEFDLSQTELVTLSACETGLGQVYEYEGVYGMQRAFKIAGAEYIIMSLWEVPDKDTKAFMTKFYDFYLLKGLPIPTAFYKAQKEMLEDNDVEEWAGFVLLK